MSETYFAPWFRRQLALREWSQADFSRRAVVSSSTVSQWATGKRKPGPASADVIADVLGHTTNDVMRILGYLPAAAERSPDDAFRDRLKSLIDGIPVSMLGLVEPMLQGLYDQAQRSRMRVIDGRRAAGDRQTARA